MTQPPQVQSAEGTESVVANKLQKEKGKKRTCIAGRLHVARIHDLRHARETAWNQQRTAGKEGHGGAAPPPRAHAKTSKKGAVQRSRHVDRFPSVSSSFHAKTLQDRALVSDWRPTCPCGLLALTLRPVVCLRDPWKNHRRMDAHVRLGSEHRRSEGSVASTTCVCALCVNDMRMTLGRNGERLFSRKTPGRNHFSPARSPSSESGVREHARKLARRNSEQAPIRKGADGPHPVVVLHLKK